MRTLLHRRTHESFSSSRGVAPLGLVTTLPLMLDMPFPPTLPIERESGAQLHAVVSQSQPSAVAFGYATGSVLRTVSWILRYSVLVPLGLPSPCRGPP